MKLAIEKDTGFAKAELWSIDLTSFAQIIAFAEKFEKDGGRLDLLVMNAGILKITYEATADGYEQAYAPLSSLFGHRNSQSQFSHSLQVNHLGTSLLSLLLLPTLLKTANEAGTVSRLVVVSSDMHYFADFTKEEQASPHILNKLNSKQYCTKPSVKFQIIFS